MLSQSQVVQFYPVPTSQLKVLRSRNFLLATTLILQVFHNFYSMIHEANIIIKATNKLTLIII